MENINKTHLWLSPAPLILLKCYQTFIKQQIKCPIEVGKRGCNMRSKAIFMTYRRNARNNKTSKIEAKS